MRIVHVSDCYAPRTGGIETQVQALAERQAAAGHDVAIVTATPGAAAGPLPIHRVTMRMPGELPVHLRTRAEVTPLLRSIAPEVVHVHVGAVSPFAWGALRAARAAQLPVLVTVHSMWGPIARAGYGASRRLLGWGRWPMTLSAVSVTAAGAVARSLGMAHDSVLVLPNGIDAARWRRVAPPRESAGPLELVSVMRLAPRKRLLPLLRIIERAQGNADVRLTVIGDGPERRRGERMASGLPVVFAGRLDADGIRARFAEADAFIQPSIRESFGIAALEARSAGLPVLARRQTGTASFIVDGVNGLLADHDADLVRAVVRLANDRSLLRRMTRWNTEHAPAEDWSTVLAAVDSAYGVASRA